MVEKLADKYRVLLVEDNNDFQQLFRVYASKKNLEVMMASNGKAAVSVLARNRFDGIILDYMLPDLTGAEINMAIRRETALRLNRKTPVIVVSAVAIPTYKLEELYQCGIKLFLPKSFGLRELSVIVETLCFAARARREVQREKEFSHAVEPGASQSFA
ncbi:MAG: response regulator [bacterium]